MLGKGPQYDRDTLSGESYVMDRGTEKEVYEGEVVRLRRENESYRDQLKRSLVELRSYQLKFPSAHIVYDEQEIENLPPWATSPEVVSPLMHAYDDRIKELESVVAQQASELEIFQSKVETVIAENDTLRNMQLDQMKDPLRSSAEEIYGSDSHIGPSFMGLNPLDSISKQSNIELNERIDILMAENALMVEQKASLSNELDKYQEELTARSEELSAATERYNHMLKELDIQHNRANDAEKNLEASKGQLLASSNRIGKYESEREDLLGNVSELEQKNTILEASVRELRQNMKELSTQFDEDGTTFLKRTKAAEDRVRELHNVLMIKTQEVEKLQEVNKKLKTDNQRTRQDAEGMLQVMGGLERQISDYASREMEVDNTVREAKDKTERAIIDRDKALAKETQCRAEIDRLLAEKKVQAENRQSLIDQEVERNRERMLVQLRSTEAELDDIVRSNASSAANAEKAMREARSAQDLMERFERMRDEERKTTAKSLRECEERIASLSVEKEEEIKRRVEVQDLNKDLRSTIDKLRADFAVHNQRLHQRTRTLEDEIVSVRATLRDVQVNGIDATRKLTSKEKEIEDLKAEIDSNTENTERRRAEDMATFRKQATEFDMEKRELLASVTAEERRGQLLVEQLTQKTSATIARLETQQADARQQLNRQNQKIRELDSFLKQAEDEKSMFVELLNEAKSANEQLKDDLSDAQAAVSDLTAQLISASEMREEALRTGFNETIAIDNEAEGAEIDVNI